MAPLTLPAPLGFQKIAIRTNVVTTLVADLGPTGTKQLKTVAGEVRVREAADLRKVIPKNKLPACFVIEALGEHLIGRSSTIINYPAPSKHHIFDLRLNLICILAFNPKVESPDTLVATLEEAMLASLLKDNLRGGTADFTEPLASNHTSYLFGDRVMYRLSIGCPFKFRRPV